MTSCNPLTMVSEAIDQGSNVLVKLIVFFMLLIILMAVVSVAKI